MRLGELLRAELEYDRAIYFNGVFHEFEVVRIGQHEVETRVQTQEVACK